MLDTQNIAMKGHKGDTLSIASKGYIYTIVDIVKRNTRRLARIPAEYLVFPRFSNFK